MVYNRCVGTRFCSNNCPYKVRRFNFANYAHEEMRPPIARNPDVTARTRGVMEKCTFCVQRIVEARIAHDRDGVPERTTTACAAACPTQAFTFGDLNDKESEVVKRKQSPIDYPLLPEESTYPRVTYEARIRNRERGGQGLMPTLGRPRSRAARRSRTRPPARTGAQPLHRGHSSRPARPRPRSPTGSASIALRPHTPLWWWGELRRRAGAARARRDVGRLAVRQRHRRVRQRLAGDVGLPDPALRLVDRASPPAAPSSRRCSS